MRTWLPLSMAYSKAPLSRQRTTHTAVYPRLSLSDLLPAYSAPSIRLTKHRTAPDLLSLQNVLSTPTPLLLVCKGLFHVAEPIPKPMYTSHSPRSHRDHYGRASIGICDIIMMLSHSYHAHFRRILFSICATWDAFQLSSCNWTPFPLQLQDPQNTTIERTSSSRYS